MTGSKKKLILFTDDDEDDFLLLRDLFKESNQDVELRWAKDGEEALDFLRRQENPKPFLILLDLNMPKLNGREILKQVRSHKELCHIPVIVLTNSMNRQEAVEVYQSGANSFIRKPSGYKDLREFVRVFYKYWFDYSLLV